MDYSRFPIEKLIYFAAAIIPGGVALFIFALSAPGSFHWFFELGFIGYKTKIGMILLIAAVIGITLTTLLHGLVGGVGGIVGWKLKNRLSKSPLEVRVAPWRNHVWRIMVKGHLGSQAPNDSLLISEYVFELRRKALELLPEDQRLQEAARLETEKLRAEQDDIEWSLWYAHFQQFVLFPNPADFSWNFRNGLFINLQAAAIYVLISSIVVPQLRFWWIILPSSVWILVLIAEVWVIFKGFADPHSTLSAQLRYLADRQRASSNSSSQ